MYMIANEAGGGDSGGGAVGGVQDAYGARGANAWRHCVQPVFFFAKEDRYFQYRLIPYRRKVTNVGLVGVHV